MKKYLLLPVIAVIIVSIYSFLPIYAAEDNDSTDSGQVDQETINENIKERIKKVSEEAATLTEETKRRALVGILEKIANNTLTIKTKSDIKLASVSAETSFVRSPGNQNSSIDDAALGDFIIAMGYTNGSDVLETKRVVLQEEAPEPVNKRSAFGILTNIDEDNDQVTITQPDGTTLTLDLTKNTDILLQINSDQEEVESENLPLNQTLLVVYQPNEVDASDEEAEPEEETEKQVTNTALLILALPSEETEAELDESEESTESAEMKDSEDEETPPELAQ